MIQSIFGHYMVNSKENSAKMVFLKKRCLIGFYLETLALDGQRENGSITGANFGEGAGVEKVKSLKEIKTQFCGKDIVVIRVLWTCTHASLALHNQGLWA